MYLKRSPTTITPFGFGMSKKERLVAISFSGKLSLFGAERGISSHENFNDEDALYTADTTVLSDVKNRDIGRNLKYATVLIAMGKGYRVFTGRNRQEGFKNV